MSKLKVLTMTVKEIPGSNFHYTVYNADGVTLATRVSCRSCLGTTFIAALVTKNHNYRPAYTIKYLATAFGNLKTKSPIKSERPYGIAVVDEYREAFIAWAKAQREKADNITK